MHDPSVLDLRQILGGQTIAVCSSYARGDRNDRTCGWSRGSNNDLFVFTESVASVLVAPSSEILSTSQKPAMSTYVGLKIEVPVLLLLASRF